MAKRNDGQAIENKRFREIPDSAPSMISMTYGADAKRLVSFGETNPFVFAIFGPSTRETKPALRAGTAAMSRKARGPERGL
jgi:hypothetical protein